MAKFPVTPDSENTDMGLKMTPMIDIVFQMLIFLMCALHFRSLEAVLETRLPADLEIASPLKNTKTRDVLITLAHNGNNPLMPAIKLDGRPLAGYDELTKALTNMRNADKNASIIIEPQGEVPTQCVVEAIDACKKAGIIPKLSK